MVRIGRCQVVRRMTGIAIRGHRLELAVGGILVAGIAVNGCMRAGQREAVVVLLNLRDRNLPSTDGVTLLAVRAQLPAMNVGVAILAALADIAEHRFHMALGAGHRGVHTAQWIFGLIVVEFRNRPDGTPGIRGVTVLAGKVEAAVWAVRSARRLAGDCPCGSRENQKHRSD